MRVTYCARSKRANVAASHLHVAMIMPKPELLRLCEGHMPLERIQIRKTKLVALARTSCKPLELTTTVTTNEWQYGS